MAADAAIETRMRRQDLAICGRVSRSKEATESE
jgi:hypothetical protein